MSNLTKFYEIHIFLPKMHLKTQNLMLKIDSENGTDLELLLLSHVGLEEYKFSFYWNVSYTTSY